MATPVDIDKTLQEIARLTIEIGALVRLATDLGASHEERRTAAMAACDRIRASGALERIADAQVWFVKNRVHFDRAIKLGGLIQSFRGR